jgi:gliding motility-associated-like protein
MNMKRLILFSLIAVGFLPVNSTAQWVEVTNPQNTTQNYGGVDVTVTAVNPSFNGGCEGTYWVANTGDNYTFTFNPAVSAVQFYCDAINPGEQTAWIVNGSPFPLTTCNVANFVNGCSEAACDLVNGYLENVSFGLCGGLITLYGNITSVTLMQQVGSSGTTFDVWIPPGVNIPAPGGSVTAGSNSPVNCGDTLALTATATGATSYSWVGPNGFTSTQQNPQLQVNSLGAGQYIVTAMTSCGAVMDTIDVVVNPFNMIPVVNSNSPLCAGGTLILTIANNPNNATYSWTGPGGFTSTVASPTINPVAITDSGQYIVTVTVNNCTSQPGSTVVDVDPLPPLPTVTDVTYCLGATAVPLTAQGNNLVWYITSTGGTPLPGAPTPSTSVAGTTTYYVASTGPAPTFCEGNRAAIDVTIYAYPFLPVIDYKNSYCPNEPFEPFVVQVGTNVQYYDSAVGGTGTTTPPVVDVTSPGVYQWYATQTVNGCESGRFPITIIVHPFIAAAFNSEIRWGCTEDTVILTNASIGATSGYEWSFGDGFTDTAANPVHIYADQGIYNIQLISKAPYCRDTAEQTIDINHPMQASFTADIDSICQHQVITFTNTSSATPINGIQPTFWWSFGDGSFDANQNTAHTFDHSGTYIVQMIMTDFVPCKDTAWMYVYVDSISPLSLTKDPTEICAGEAVDFAATYSEQGLVGVMWEFGDGITKYDMNPARHTYEQPGTYNIKISTDYRICRDTSAELTVLVKPTPVISLGPDTSMCPTAGPLVLQDLINAGNPAAKWWWNTGDRSFNIAAKSPDTYYATVDIDGCVATDSITIWKDCYLDVPNAFSPDGDALNDYFLPRQLLSEGVTSFKMQVFNRWGQEIFSTTNLNGRGWDGRFNGEPQPQGVYIYLIEVGFHNGTKEKKQGNVTLLR